MASASRNSQGVRRRHCREGRLEAERHNVPRVTDREERLSRSLARAPWRWFGALVGIGVALPRGTQRSPRWGEDGAWGGA